MISIEELEKKLLKAKNNNALPKLLIPVHLAGASCNMNEIKKLSIKYGFKIIEDASHAIGGKYNNNYVGDCQFSEITVFSFHPVKIITSGEGGIATTNDEELAYKLLNLRSHGIEKNNKKFLSRTDKPWIYEQQDLGYNYRMTDIHAALGISQIERLDEFVRKRNDKFNYYKFLLKDLQNISLLKVEVNVYSAFHLVVIILDEY